MISLRLFDEALIDNRAALKIDPKSAISYRQRGDIHAEKGDLNSALRAYNRALELDKDLATSLENRSQIYLQTGEFNKAIEDQKKSLATSRDKRRSEYGLVGAYRVIGETEEAIELLDAAIEQYPADAAALNREKAWIELDRNNFEGAIKTLQNLSEGSDGNPGDLYLLAASLETAGKNSEATKLYESLTQSHPVLWQAWLRLSQLSLRGGGADQAITYAMEACRRSRFLSSDALSALAAAYHAKGQPEEAVNWQRRAIARLPVETLAEQRLRFAEELAKYASQELSASPEEANR